MNDPQTDNLLKRARLLNAILEEELPGKVLEVLFKKESADNKELLNRVIRSLDQYVNKKKDLVYIGFLGHFSSGKSSTINSLLGIGDTSDKRDTGLNPTDKVITLITHPENSSSLMLMSREVAIVPVRTIFLKLDFLKSIVVCDTPGSGDPHVVNEMIQDFLPICDVIFYCVSAANPIDNADLPLLIQKNSKLPFIPLRYIVTRTDEFRISKNQSVSDTNLDVAKRDNFLGQLVSRIKEITSASEILPKDFLFIDNVDRFNIDMLRDSIIAQSDTLNPEALIKMHGHKVDYYSAQVDRIFKYYLSQIDEKILQTRAFVKTAQDNIERFDNAIEHNNEKLKILWAKGETLLKEALASEIRGLEELAVVVPASLIVERQVSQAKKAIGVAMDNFCNGFTGMIVADVNAAIKEKLRNLKYHFNESIEKSNVDIDSIEHLFPGRLDLSTQLDTIEVDFARISDTLKEYDDAAYFVLNNLKVAIRSSLGSIRQHANKQFLIKALTKNDTEGRDVINGSFDSHFDKIQMYRGAVLTRNTKETIQKLSIGAQLDILDTEFAEEFMKEKKRDVNDSIYRISERDLNEFKAKVEAILAQALEARDKTDKVSIQNVYNSLATLGKEKVNVAAYVQSVINQRELVANTLYQQQLGLVLDDHMSKAASYKSELESQRKQIKKNIRYWSFGLAIFGLSLFALLKVSNIIAPPTIGMTIFLGLLTGAISHGLGIVIGRARNDLKAATNIKRDEFVKARKAELYMAFSDSYWEDLGKKTIDEKPAESNAFLVEKYSARVNPIVGQITDERGKKLLEFASMATLTNKILNEYKNLVHDFYKKYSVIFIDTDLNIQSISNTTSQIKEIAIRPSFELLESTTKALELVEERINEISES